jgi:MFS transporter, DHA1 family, multidrug resistance protein
MIDILRDSTVGQIINRISHGRLLPYPDQRPDYIVPEKYKVNSTRSPSPDPEKSRLPKVTPELVPPVAVLNPDNASVRAHNRESFTSNTATVAHSGKDLEEGNASYETLKDKIDAEDLHSELEKKSDPFLVDWDGPEDPENPRYAFLSTFWLMQGSDHNNTGIGHFSRDHLSHFQFRSSHSLVR